MAKTPRTNVSMEVDGSTLVITIELDDVTKVRSKSGKSNLVATTGGNIPVPGKPDLRIGVNLYEPI